MRIIGGSHRGRKFMPPAKISARPTTDLAKEGLFNTLNNMVDFEELKALELFGGTGNISYELASRGVLDITIVEKDRRLVNFIKNEIKKLGFDSHFSVLEMNVFKFLEQINQHYSFIFADPPYALKEMNQLPDLIFEKNLLLPDGFFVLEHTMQNNFSNHPNFEKSKKYGMTNFSYFRMK